MTNPPDETLPTPELARGQRLYIVDGQPWRKALRWFSGEEVDVAEKIWRWEAGYRDGDLLLTVVETRPRMVLCLEVAYGDEADNGRRIWTREEETIVFGQGISFDALVVRSGVQLQRRTHYVGQKAQAILTALETERTQRTWFSPSRWLMDNNIHPDFDLDDEQASLDDDD